VQAAAAVLTVNELETEESEANACRDVAACALLAFSPPSLYRATRSPPA
jgi:hypothetical protein